MVSLCGGVICVWKGKWDEVFPHARFLDPFASSAIWGEQRVPLSHLKVSLKTFNIIHFKWSNWICHLLELSSSSG